MGTVASYETAAGKRYRVRYRTPDRRQTDKRGFRTKREAELYLAMVEVKKASGEYIKPSDARVSVATLMPDWLAGKEAALKPSSFHVLQTAWRVHGADSWGHRFVGEIRHSEVQSWVAKLATGRSATVTIRAYGILAGVLDGAVRDRRIASNPARNVDLPRKTKKQRRYLTIRQVEALAEQSGDRRLLVFVLAYCGLRWGEAVAIRVGSFDPTRRRILVQANAPFVAGRIEPGTPKSHEKRSVPVPAFLAAELSLAASTKSQDDLLFGSTGGGFQRPPSFTRGWFQEAKKRARAADQAFPIDLTLHDLRHTAASLAISSGATVLSVQRMLGHASAAMTLDTYSDLFEDDLDAVAERLNQSRQDSIVGKVWAESPTITSQHS